MIRILEWIHRLYDEYQELIRNHNYVKWNFLFSLVSISLKVSTPESLRPQIFKYMLIEKFYVWEIFFPLKYEFHKFYIQYILHVIVGGNFTNLCFAGGNKIIFKLYFSSVFLFVHWLYMVTLRIQILRSKIFVLFFFMMEVSKKRKFFKI